MIRRVALAAALPLALLTAPAAFAAATAPSAPTITGIVPGDGQETLTIAAPKNSGGAHVLGYIVTAAGGAKSVSVSSSTSPVVVKGLTDGVTYSFSAKAFNSVGEGAPSAVVKSAPVAGPVALTLTGGQTFVPLGTTVTYSGTLTRGLVGVPATPVFVTETYSDGKQVTLGTTTTSAAGDYSFTTSPLYNGTIRVSALTAVASVPSKVIVSLSTPKVVAAHGTSLTITCSSAPGFITGPNREERAQLLWMVDGHSRVLGLVAAAQRTSAHGYAHGVNVVTFHVRLPAAGHYRLAVKILGTPVNTGATSRILSVAV